MVELTPGDAELIIGALFDINRKTDRIIELLTEEDDGEEEEEESDHP